MESKQTEEVTIGNFPLMNMPIDYQLTIHVNNLLVFYGNGIIKEIKKELYGEAYSLFYTKNLVIHYGASKVQDWFTLIYGWDFNKKVG